MMKYKNKRTGAVIDVHSQISGRDWVKVEEEKSPSSTKSGRPRGKKNG